MTRTAITKLAATALTVASLGLTASAQAADQSIAIGEPTPGSGVPAQPAQPTGGDGDYHGPEDGSQAKPAGETQRPKTCKELQEMGYRIGCPTDERPEPSPHPKPHPTHPTTHEPTYEKPHYREHKPVYRKAEEPNQGSLPYTGLEIWQLGLIGMVLAGGGIGARRLLVA